LVLPGVCEHQDNAWVEEIQRPLSQLTFPFSLLLLLCFLNDMKQQHTARIGTREAHKKSTSIMALRCAKLDMMKYVGGRWCAFSLQASWRDFATFQIFANFHHKWWQTLTTIADEPATQKTVNRDNRYFTQKIYQYERFAQENRLPLKMHLGEPATPPLALVSPIVANETRANKGKQK
jgi:hypothetical protein